MKQKLLSLFVAACCSITMFGGNILPLDWDYIPSEYLYSITNPSNAVHKALTQMKAARDEVYLYIWAEFDTNYLDTYEYWDEPGYMYMGSVPFHVYLNDGKHEGFTGMWSESTPAAILLEGYLFDSGKPINYKPSAFRWPDYEESSVGWLWEEISTQPIVESVVTDRTVELVISIASLPLSFDQDIYVGIEIEKHWETLGMLPYQTLDGKGNVESQEMMKIVKISPCYLWHICINHLFYDFDSRTQTATVTGCDNDITNLTIPKTVTYKEQTYSVTTIGDYAFEGFSSLTSVTIPNSVTTIGEDAFYNCTSLTSVTIPNSVTTIGEGAFYNCTSLTSITCFAVNPPSCGSYVFGINQDTKVYVLASSLSAYQSADEWKDLNLLPLGAEETPMEGDEPVVTPTESEVTITWAITEGTDTYTLTITQTGETVCVLTFNANGQLANIAFAAPCHNGSRQAPAATLTAQGYQFTVTGLNPGTAYEYSVTATDAQGETIAEHTGNFSTTGGTGFESVHGSQCTMHKYLHNGTLIIDRNGKHYSAVGERIR